jgi:hypothetical protein
MDEWLKNAPALLYGNNTWLVVNKLCELCHGPKTPLKPLGF